MKKLLFGTLFIALISPLTAIALNSQKAHLIDIKTAIPDVTYDIKYFGEDNFVGVPIDGYHAAKCLIDKRVIADLKAASTELQQQSFRFKFFDCYRPERAVAHFMHWANDLSDTTTKAKYYPNLKKSELVGPYIAEKSGHSKGFTIDLTIEQLKHGKWSEVDMGSAFDLFDEISHTVSPNISKQQQLNRLFLKNTLANHGFKNYHLEWWHYTYQKIPKAQFEQSYDFIVK